MLSIDQTIKNCNQIKSIVLTIQYDTFFVNRCLGIVQLFGSLQQLIPDIFNENSVKNCVYILITKSNNPFEIIGNLTQIIKDVENTDKNILCQLEVNNNNSLQIFEKRKLQERLKIWQFVHNLIQNHKILSYSVNNALMAEETLGELIQSPCINKKYFCKAMDRQDIQMALSKYIIIQIDTWQRQIFDNFFRYIPNEIQEAEKQKLNKINSIKEKEQENMEKKQQINRTKQQIKDTQTQIQKLEKLIQSEDQNQIIQELENNNKFSNFTSNIIKDAYDQVEHINMELTRKTTLLSKNQNDIKSEEEKISIIQKEIKQLQQEIDKLQTGNSQKLLHEYKENGEEMEYFEGDDNLNEYKQAFDNVSRFGGQGIKKKVKTCEFTGHLLHLVYIEQDFYIVPKGSTTSCQQMYNQELIVDGRYYKAIVEGEHWEFEIGGKARPDRKKMVYSIRTNWQKGRALPWFKITHDLPNKDLNEGTITIKQGQIDSKENIVIRKGECIKELRKENNDIENDISLKQLQIKSKDKIIQEAKKEKGLEQLKDKIITLKTFINNSKGDIEFAEQSIVTNDNVIQNEKQHIQKKEQELRNLQKQQLHFAIIIESKIEIASLLRVFARISIDGLGIDQKNIDSNLNPQLIQYSEYYDKMVTKIKNLCEETFRNLKNSKQIYQQ